MIRLLRAGGALGHGPAGRSDRPGRAALGTGRRVSAVGRARAPVVRAGGGAGGVRGRARRTAAGGRLAADRRGVGRDSVAAGRGGRAATPVRPSGARVGACGSLGNACAGADRARWPALARPDGGPQVDLPMGWPACARPRAGRIGSGRSVAGGSKSTSTARAFSRERARACAPAPTCPLGAGAHRLSVDAHAHRSRAAPARWAGLVPIGRDETIPAAGRSGPQVASAWWLATDALALLAAGLVGALVLAVPWDARARSPSLPPFTRAVRRGALARRARRACSSS